ncbi:MAG: hypothetical protein K2Q24_05585 [Chitinophagaceae bacterium]|nr:hypothetical protein [Chitinophagaceae bacterium]
MLNRKQANAVEISLVETDYFVCLQITDKGKGFDQGCVSSVQEYNRIISHLTSLKGQMDTEIANG